MGSFAGHVVPGGIFLAAGFWWMINIVCRYVTAVKHNVPFRSASWFPTRRWATVELDVIIMLVFVMNVVEVITGFQTPTGEFAWKNTQHMVSDSAFAITRIVQHLEFKKFTMIPNLDYFCYALANFVSAILFLFHLHARTLIDVTLHTFVAYGLFAVSIASLLEVFHKTLVIVPMARAMLTIFTGLYFCTIGLVIYPPFNDDKPLLDLESHEVYNMITALWVLELLLTIALGMVMTILINKFYSGDPVYLKEMQDEKNVPLLLEIRSNGLHHVENGKPSKLC